MPPKRAKKMGSALIAQQPAADPAPTQQTLPIQRLDPDSSDSESEDGPSASTDNSNSASENTPASTNDGAQHEEPTKDNGKDEKTDGKGKKKRKRKHDFTNFKAYIHKVQKDTHPDLGMTKNTAAVMSDIVKDICLRIAKEAATLCKKSKRNQITARDIQSAVKLVYCDALIGHAISEGNKALSRFRKTTGVNVQ